MASTRRSSQSEVSIVGAYSGGGCGDKECRDIGCRMNSEVKSPTAFCSFDRPKFEDEITTGVDDDDAALQNNIVFLQRFDEFDNGGKKFNN